MVRETRVRGRKGAGSVGRRQASAGGRAQVRLRWRGGMARSRARGRRGRPYRRRVRRGKGKASRLRLPRPINPLVRRPSLGRCARAGGRRRTDGYDVARSGSECGVRDASVCACHGEGAASGCGLWARTPRGRALAHDAGVLGSARGRHRACTRFGVSQLGLLLFDWV
jgi:hypothetical protein